jgi:alanine racemase
VFNLSECEKLSQIAQKLNITAKVHIKIDTGMNRVGYSYANTSALVREVSAISIMRYIQVDGIYSHLATSDSDAEFANEQFTRFSAVCHALISSGVYIPVKHISNSGAVLNHPSFNLDMVRCGIILYGLAPCSTPEGAKALAELGFKPALTLKSRISHIKTIRAGESVGYGRNFFATDDTVVASIPLGYADGISRKLSNTGTVLVNGKVCRIIGNVCMDQLMVNVTGANAALRGEVVFIGQDGWHTQTAEDIASLQGTINYEVATSLSLRLPTYYTAQ